MFKIREIKCYFCNELIEKEIFSILTLPKLEKATCQSCKDKLIATASKDIVSLDNRILLINRSGTPSLLREFAVVNVKDPEQYYFLTYIHGDEFATRGYIKNLKKHALIDDTYIENYIIAPSHRRYLELGQYLPLLKELVNQVPIPRFILP